MVDLDTIKQEICDIGRRLYQKGFAAANDGNISYRIDDNQVLCTPTLVSKGFMKPDDLCVVDMEGSQIGGSRERTSEIKLHLAIMKARPDVKAAVHCHPPHATAFAIAREPVPQCVMPEVEVCLGVVPITQFAIPGSQKFAESVLPFVHQTNVMILANHGTISVDDTLEKAYWWTEILDAYCRIVMLARGLGRISYLSQAEMATLLKMKAELGLNDPRIGMDSAEVCAADVSGPFASQSPVPGAGADTATLEALIETVTDRVMAALKAR